MFIRAVGERLAVDISALEREFSSKDLFALLRRREIVVEPFDLVNLARAQTGVGRYELGASLGAAPEVVDCSSLTKWLYGQYGIWIPRKAIQQSGVGTMASLDSLKAGDLVFTRGRRPLFRDDPETGIGHVGIMLGRRTILHAKNGVGVIQEPVERFVGRLENFRGGRRIVAQLSRMRTLIVPKELEIETSDDLYFRLKIDAYYYALEKSGAA